MGTWSCPGPLIPFGNSSWERQQCKTQAWLFEPPTAQSPVLCQTDYTQRPWRVSLASFKNQLPDINSHTPPQR